MADADFEIATKYVHHLPKEGPVKPTTMEKLDFYRYYKQATLGPCSLPKPGMLAIEAKAKWESWTSVKDMSREEAKVKYIECLERMDPSWKDNAKKHNLC